MVRALGGLEPHEQLVINCSRYLRGDFLALHYDRDDACTAFVRQVLSTTSGFLLAWLSYEPEYYSHP